MTYNATYSRRFLPNTHTTFTLLLPTLFALHLALPGPSYAADYCSKPAAQPAQLLPAANAPDDAPLLIADFEQPAHTDWQILGDAFGTGPVDAALPSQKPVTGFQGHRFVTSHHIGDAAQGRLISPTFTIQRPYINFLIGGGCQPGLIAAQLVIDSRIVRSATALSQFEWDVEHLAWHSWDVRDLQGRSAHIVLVDGATGPWGHFNFDHLEQSNQRRMIDYANPDIARATNAVNAAIPLAQADPARPVYHFRAPARWMNDPSGLLHYKGYYHLFYQLNPYYQGWGHAYWGHARSRDLVNWEHLPIALWPSREHSENLVASGCLTLSPQGKPSIFYSSYKTGLPLGLHAEEWLALPADDDLITWTKYPENPILPETLHQDFPIYDWRDMDIFSHQGQTYAVMGGNLNQAKGGQAIVGLYQAKNPSLTQWTFRGILFQHPSPNVLNIECPRLARLGNKWLLIISRQGPTDVEYFVGDVDFQNVTFTPTSQGLLDIGTALYAPHVLRLDTDRLVTWGWVMFPPRPGWAGCLTLPRDLSLDPQGRLRQQPVPELTALRAKAFHLPETRLTDSPRSADLPPSDTLEILASARTGPDAAWSIRLLDPTCQKEPLTIACQSGKITVAGRTVATTPGPSLDNQSSQTNNTLHVFLDKAVLEVYLNQQHCYTHPLPDQLAPRTVEIAAQNGPVTLKSLDVWHLKSIW